MVSHIRIAERPEDIHAVRIAAGSARLVLGCDMMVAASFDALAKMRPDFTRAVVNDHAAMTGDFTRDPDMTFPANSMAKDIGRAVGDESADFVNATRLATALLGDAIGANLFVLGYAIQKGLIPVTLDAIERAVELNGVAVEMNKRALAWGRLAAHDPAAVEAAAAPRQARSRSRELSNSLDEVIERRLKQLTAFQDADYARRYKDLIVRVQKAETQRVKGRSDLTEAVARYFFKLLAYKDEYEVARLFSDGDFDSQLRAQFNGDYKVKVHLGPAPAGGARPGDRPPEETGIRAVDPDRLPAARQVQAAARHGAGPVRLHRRAPPGAPTDRRLRADHRGADRGSDRGDPRHRRFHRVDPGTDPGLRPHQGGEHRRRQGARGGPARRVPRPGANGNRSRIGPST